MKKRSTKCNEQLKEVVQTYKLRCNAIRKRLGEFSKVLPDDYFYELVYCLLTPQSSAAHAEEVAAKLRSLKFHIKDIDPEPFLRQKECYIRFHRTKSKHLIRMKGQFHIIAQKLSEPASAFDLRDWMVKNIVGIGYKEATHFLRNIGRNEGLAILDRHILRNLKQLQVINYIPNTISRKNYLDIEQRFSEFANKINIELDELDLVFWSMGTGEIRK